MNSVKKEVQGHLHPMTLIQNSVISAYINMGFEITEGPIVESDWYNFEGLNMLAGHPARDMQDTFYIKNKKGPDGLPMVLRTQLSHMQLRYPEQHSLPYKIVYFGKVFRNEATDAVHEAEHSQFECMVVSKNANLGQLKGTIENVLSHVFGSGIKTRLRPGFFPFVEPGVEVDMECFKCHGKDQSCSVCKGVGWIEGIGAGVMNPVVLKNGGIDTNEWQGFAYAIGWDRLAMAKYKVEDIRLFNSGDLRLTQQF